MICPFCNDDLNFYSYYSFSISKCQNHGNVFVIYMVHSLIDNEIISLCKNGFSIINDINNSKTALYKLNGHHIYDNSFLSFNGWNYSSSGDLLLSVPLININPDNFDKVLSKLLKFIPFS